MNTTNTTNNTNTPSNSSLPSGGGFPLDVLSGAGFKIVDVAAGSMPATGCALVMDGERELTFSFTAGTTGWLRLESSEIPVNTAGRAGELPLFLDEALAPPGPFKLAPAADPNSVHVLADLPLRLETSECQGRPEPLPRGFLESGWDLESGVDSGAGHPRRGEGLLPWALDLKSASAALLALHRTVGLPGSEDLAHGVRPSRSGRKKKRSRRKKQTAHLGPGGNPAVVVPSPPSRECMTQDVPPCPTTQALLQRLSTQGWVCSEKHGEIYVSFVTRHYLKQARLRPTEGGVCLEMELADMREWPSVSRRAAVELARQANEALWLVRLVCRDPARPAGAVDAPPDSAATLVLAQVRLGRLSADPRWLRIALEALGAAANLLSMELPVLVDGDLANWILEASCR